MPKDIKVKLCGLTRPEDVAVAAEAGAAYVGFVFFPKSPRYVSLPHARDMALSAPIGLAKVALVVNADNATLDSLTDQVPLDMLQLHGHESPDRVLEVKKRYGLPVMKAVGVADETDLAAIDTYSEVADQILLDTKPPKDATRPGGNAVAFDWNLIAGRRWSVPWMLAGGLTVDNVAEAIQRTGANQLDLSSALESAPGVKDHAKMRAFVKAALA
ncbi:phosphoribosylanthranilate isomerase [Roseovarius rhodophyticola]|uniref:N-(5'-phosphoribosyl)anthranilate isomerase n=1 Tax=Roseovarius rhodophyticola TaxID=3080827 RepID=A0ABZ2TKQ8_9RHOB|nr:phosphoribosylanthranilate isomerase [Roseovarius sp. W115]MDV2928977.1 phosphoribosylanthranilate isomerase [Roseovarius sp. W115]